MEIPLLSVLHLAPIEYFNLISQHQGRFCLDIHESYQKQSYRNRFCILSSQGVQTLSIPIIHGKESLNIKDARIDYSINWHKNHWNSLETCYRKSAFFEFYQDYFRETYQTKPLFLFDLNLALLEIVFNLLKWSFNPTFTERWIPPSTHENDFRQQIHPKSIAITTNNSYYQVFSDRHPFIPNLSIVDSLFNIGGLTDPNQQKKSY